MRQALVCRRVLINPEVLIHRKGLTMAMPPVTFTPVTNVITSTNVEGNYNGRVNLNLGVLDRGTAVTNASAACLLTICRAVLVTRDLNTKSGVLDRSLTNDVRITNERLLARADDATQVRCRRRVARHDVSVVEVTTLRRANNEATATVMIRRRQVLLKDVRVE